MGVAWNTFSAPVFFPNPCLPPHGNHARLDRCLVVLLVVTSNYDLLLLRPSSRLLGRFCCCQCCCPVGAWLVRAPHRLGLSANISCMLPPNTCGKHLPSVYCREVWYAPDLSVLLCPMVTTLVHGCCVCVLLNPTVLWFSHSPLAIYDCCTCLDLLVSVQRYPQLLPWPFAACLKSSAKCSFAQVQVSPKHSWVHSGPSVCQALPRGSQQCKLWLLPARRPCRRLVASQPRTDGTAVAHISTCCNMDVAPASFSTHPHSEIRVVITHSPLCHRLAVQRSLCSVAVGRSNSLLL